MMVRHTNTYESEVCEGSDKGRKQRRKGMWFQMGRDWTKIEEERFSKRKSKKGEWETNKRAYETTSIPHYNQCNIYFFKIHKKIFYITSSNDQMLHRF